MASQTPSSSASSSTPPSGWDVFLSFWGEDTRYDFTSHLYSALDRRGIRTFMDYPELATDQVIRDLGIKAIQESKTCVVVFSKNYASSGLCLDQLVEILNCKKTRSIIGVYYNIDPLVVKHQTGSFGKALKKHQSRAQIRFLKIPSPKYRAIMKKVDNWRTALRNVSVFPGVQISADRSESDTIKEVVDKVLSLIKPMNLDVAKYPVGLDFRVECITALMKSVTEGVARIGIHGMGGVGKTTLAKAVYNQNCYRFQGSCFLENVREALVLKRGLVCLQQQLINDVLKCKNINIDNVDQGIELIRARMCSKKVLIVIDDLDDPRPLKFLEGPFALGSLTIITTRNEDLLDSIGVETRYKVNELGDTESHQLFTQHAYGEHIPETERFIELSQEILKHAGGLPLALEVFGSSVCNKSEEELICVDELKRVSIANVEKKLVLSFDALELVDPVLQDIFLDVACFFVGWNKEEVVKILKTCYKFVNPSIDILIKRCLLTTNDRDELGMHNLIRDMGREIARNNSPDEPGKHSRLWVLKEICDVLKNHMGTEAIEGIYYQVALEGVSFTTATFKRMTKLRFLYLKKVHLIGSYEQKFEELRWFCWDCCPLECLPSEFHLKKLVILALPHSKIRTMWEPDMVFEKLKILDMKYSLDLTTTPNFSRLPCLETLNLEHCESLEEVHVSIGSLARLVSFNLCGCVKLRSLPNTICNLSSLKSLNVVGCSSLEALPVELRNIESLAELNARIPTATELLDSTGLSKIVELNLSEKEHLESPSYSALTSLTMKWDVFLSFRGIDTRDTLTDSLYTALDRHGLRTFRDDPEVHSGKVMSNTLLQAIQESKTFIVVLSENYVSSSWCLDELVEILNCHRKRKTGGLVLPVFYNIEPSDVRHQSEGVKKVFEIHQIQFSGELEKVNKWRHTLTDVSNISAICISEKRSGAEVINEIVDIILLKLKPKTLDVAKYPVGLDSRVNAIMPLLSSGTEGVHKFGIYGIAGVGKTSLAKALYNELLRGASFEGSCFLANIREVSKRALGLVTLQKQLIDDVLKQSNFKVNSVHDGTRFIRDRFGSMKVLVVIDDVDEHEQCESLVGPFASGSVVIITTRNEQVLHAIEVEPRCRYMVHTLDDAESLALFTQYAFGNAKPNNTLMLYSKEILRHAGGLPLALEFWGSYLSEKPESGWKYFINKLRRIPQSIIQQKLKISFHALKVDPFLHDIFLDIACFFIGRKKEKVVKILETYYSCVDQYINILEKRCLLTTDNRDNLGMHDLLRDMGREIACNNSADEPGKHTRLWVATDIYDVLTKQQGTEAIEGIVFTNFDYQDDLGGVFFRTETFKRMSKLRFLYLRNVNLAGSFVNTLDNLRWLCWDFCPLECLPSDFYLQKLVILELPRSKLRTVWDLNTVSEVFQKLNTLSMKYSQYLTITPDFTKLPCLDTLNLEGCESLEEVHISIGSLARLASLNLRGCVKLRSLPESFCNLRALESLNLGGCSSLEELPEDLGNIKSLTELNAEILNVSKIPDSIGHLSKLVTLRLSSNKNLKTLPATICNLKSLEILDISGCEKLEILPDKLWELPRLREPSSGINKTPEYKIKPDALSLQKMDLRKSNMTALQLLNP